MSPAHSGVPGAHWDEELCREGGHFLQSSAWTHAQAALGYATAWEEGDGWRWAGAMTDRRGLGYLYLPHGPTLLSGGALEPALASAVAAARDRALAFVRLEPAGDVARADLERAGARAAAPVQPVHTAILDLDGGEDELRSGLSAGHRGSINAAARRGLRFRASRDPEDIEVFLSLIHRLAAAGRFHPQPDGYYRTILEVLLPTASATLHLAEVDGAAVAAAISFDFAGTRYYAHAASDPAQRRLSPAAPLVWTMILEARARGARRFDFWGVQPPGSADHPWSGLSQFKMAFGGRLVTRPGTWEVPVSRWRYGAHRAIRRLAGRGRRIS